ncbi:MAG: hypothetical protein JW994_01110 [Candidatus Omnitrophica bacterium]|nr:hypothetical protein [Candidatus Omnitrophota bacterium]
MADKKLSAEQELLEVIEKAGSSGNGSKKKDDESQGVSDLKINKRKAPHIYLNVIMGRLVFLREKLNGMLQLNNTDRVVEIANNVLITVICGMCVVLVMEVVKNTRKEQTLPGFMPVERKTSIVEPLLNKLDDITFYMEKLKERNIFKPTPKEVEKAPEEKEAEFKPSAMSKLSETLRLVGFSPSGAEGENYVMIEDLKRKTTHFLKEGDSIVGFKILKITGEKVTLTDGQETAELR